MNTSTDQEVMQPKSTGLRSLPSGPSQNCPVNPLIWLFFCILYSILWLLFSRSVVSDSVIPFLSMGFPRQEYWSGLPFPSPGDFPAPGIEPASPESAGRFFTTSTTWEAPVFRRHMLKNRQPLPWTVVVGAWISVTMVQLDNTSCQQDSSNLSVVYQPWVFT